MHTKSKLVVNVVELLKDPGSRKDLAFSEGVEGLELELARVPAGEQLRFELTLEAIEEGILVRGPVSGRYVTTCRRCLEETTHELAFDAAELYRPAKDAWEEGYVVEGGEIVDLRLMVRDNVLLALPLNPVCREDCRGLCPVCGKNLNEGECDCEPQDVDLRWAALRDLLEER